MCGPDIQQTALISTISPESQVPKDHLLRAIRTMVDKALQGLDPEFDAFYADSGRDSIPPEKLFRAQLLMAAHNLVQMRNLGVHP